MLPVPKDLEYLPYQTEGIRFLSDRRAGLLADDMGLGKTVQAIGAINYLKARKVLILCPASLKINWQRECERWLVKPLRIAVINGSRAVIPEADVLIINYDLLRFRSISRQLEERQFAVLICDEAHYLKNMEAKRTKAVLGNKGVVRNAVYKFMLTGTPILNRPVELYPILKVLAPEVIHPHSDYFKYAVRYCGGYHGERGFEARGATNLEELNTRLKRFMLRRLKKDVLKDLPPRRYQTIEIEPDASQREVRELLMYNMEDLGELATLRRKTAEMKLATCIQHIKETMEEVDKLVVFAHHRDVIQRLKTELDPYRPVVLHGGMSPVQKQRSVDNFQQVDHHRIFIGQVQAAGVGITLTRACNIIFVETSWVPGEIRQAIDRCHRIGQSEPVLIQFLVVKNSIESEMMKSVFKKMDWIKKAIN